MLDAAVINRRVCNVGRFGPGLGDWPGPCPRRDANSMAGLPCIPSNADAPLLRRGCFPFTRPPPLPPPSPSAKAPEARGPPVFIGPVAGHIPSGPDVPLPIVKEIDDGDIYIYIYIYILFM